LIFTSLHQRNTDRRLCSQADLPSIVVAELQTNDQVGQRDEAGRLFGPFRKFEAGAGKDLSKTSIFCFARIIETVKVKVPDVETGQLVALDHGVSGAFDPAQHPQRAQQVTHQRGFTGAQLTAQLDEGIVQARLRRQSGGKHLRRGLVRPTQTFYNQRVTHFNTHIDAAQLLSKIQAWASALGFSQIGVTGIDLSSSEAGLSAWLARGFHGDMRYMTAHGLKRARPAELVPGTVSVITARLDYLPQATPAHWQTLEFERLRRPAEGVVSLYARGRDYHKVMRPRLQKLSDCLAGALGPIGHRVFTDSAPVLEVELAQRSGLGWRGKHTLALSRTAGSMFFLGEIFVDLALPVTQPVPAHCGTCNACIRVCPTQAIIAAQQLDARRCISYLTIEHAGAIPLELRALLGNRIYGCDDCQLICPWNKFAQRSTFADFAARPAFVGAQLTTLFAWTEEEFLRFTEGSPIRRIGHERWLRNIAVALGNALRADADPATVQALSLRAEHPSALVREHVHWALALDPAEPTQQRAGSQQPEQMQPGAPHQQGACDRHQP